MFALSKMIKIVENHQTSNFFHHAHETQFSRDIQLAHEKKIRFLAFSSDSQTLVDYKKLLVIWTFGLNSIIFCM